MQGRRRDEEPGSFGRGGGRVAVGCRGSTGSGILWTLDLVCGSPFCAAPVLWEAHTARWTLTLCVKATFLLVHGGASVLADPQDPLSGELPWDESPGASLRFPGDFAPFKPRADVLVVGHAYAHGPGGGPVDSLVARVRVGDLTKAIRVTGDRRWTQSGGRLVPSAPEPFRRMPLVFERAPRSQDNPVGVDPSTPTESALLPNLEVAEGAKAPSFGPLSSAWRARRRLCSEGVMSWVSEVTRQGGLTAGVAPEGFDFGFFNTAPQEQQIDLMRSNVAIVLEHLHPQHALLATRLPSVRPRAFRVHADHTSDIPLRCDTLWIDADRGVATLTWRGLVEIGEDPHDVGRIVVASDAPGTTTSVEGKHPKGPPTPVQAPSAPESDPDHTTQRRRVPRKEAPRAPRSERTGELMPGGPQANPLPFQQAASTGPAGPQEPLEEPFDPNAITGAIPPGPVRAALPFKRIASAGPIPPAAPSGQALPFDSTTTTAFPPGALLEEPVDKNATTGPIRPGDAGRAPLPFRKGDSSRSLEAPAPGTPARVPAPRPASGEHTGEIQVARAQQQVTPFQSPKLSGLVDRGATAPAQPEPSAPSEDDEDSLVDETTFDRAVTPMGEQLPRAASEEISVGAPEYARIVVAIERGNVAEVLTGGDLSLADIARLRRVWAKRVIEDPRLAAQLRELVETARSCD